MQEQSHESHLLEPSEPAASPEQTDASSRTNASEPAPVSAFSRFLNRFFYPYLLPLLFYGALAGYMISPAYGDAVPRIIGGGELGGWLWRYWWMKLEIVSLGIKYPTNIFERFLHILSLGRFPETGNVTDLLAMTIPLDLLLGHPGHYNVKVFLIVLLNGLAGYALSLYLTKRRGLALLAGMTLACNIFVVWEFQSSGLRQAILFFLPLFMLYLERTLVERTRKDAILLGLSFAATAIFYWFYGLFAAIYGLLRLGYFALQERRRLDRVALMLLGVRLVQAAGMALALILPFTSPYLLTHIVEPGKASALPEVTWFKSFPSLEALQNVPLRPDSRKDNLLASLARVLYSSWSVDWLYNPLQTRPVPLVLGFCAVVMSLFRLRKTWFWLGLLILFYTFTWGPYLQLDGSFVKVSGEYAVRLPYWYAFKFIPMMSRLFAPYRMGSMVMCTLLILMSLNLSALASRVERFPLLKYLGGVLFLVLYLGQIVRDPMQERRIGSNRLLPLPASEVSVPSWYYELAREKGRLGIVELPLDRQQDLLNYYQVVHSKKVLGGWADPGALPPVLRFDQKPSKVTALLQWLSLPDGMERNSFSQAVKQLSMGPNYALGKYEPADVGALEAFGYRYVVVHELGCYQLENRWGKELFARMKSQLIMALGDPVVELLEHPISTDPEFLRNYKAGMPWMVSLYSPLLIPEPRPVPLHMVVFRVPASATQGYTISQGFVGPPAPAPEHPLSVEETHTTSKPPTEPGTAPPTTPPAGARP